MKLSVIVPAYNLRSYIEECLVSLLEQETRFNFEVIVCDDASCDGTQEVIKGIAKKYPQLKVLLKPVNEGLARNIKTLLEHSKGEYIAYVDGDDIALPNKLASQVEHLDHHPDCGMVFHESDMFDSETNNSIKLYSQGFYNWSKIPTRSDITHMILYGTYMQASSVMFRRHPHLLGCVDSECSIILDYPFYILNAGHLGQYIDFIPQVLGRYRVHAGSFGAQTQRSVERREQCLKDICKACINAKQFGVSSDIIQRGLAHHRYAASLYFLQREDNLRFQKYLNESVIDGLFFDDRHHKIWQHRDNIEHVRLIANNEDLP